ncbi:MAG: hypothetical protein EXR76_12830 [Myxococcales bacterium]|nr:hypothetical protein [Myxococcales bacterium]
MKFDVHAISPIRAASLAASVPSLPRARGDVGLWLAEVQANRCFVDGTCFVLERGGETLGYLLGFSRHGHGYCTAVEVVGSAPRTSVYLLVRAFMRRLHVIDVSRAEFSLRDEQEAARTMLEALGARHVGQVHGHPGGDAAGGIFALSMANVSDHPFLAAERSDDSVAVSRVPIPTDLGSGARGGQGFSRY